MGLVERMGGVSIPRGMMGDELLASRHSVECGRLSVVDGRMYGDEVAERPMSSSMAL